MAGLAGRAGRGTAGRRARRLAEPLAEPHSHWASNSFSPFMLLLLFLRLDAEPAADADPGLALVCCRCCWGFSSSCSSLASAPCRLARATRGICLELAKKDVSPTS